MCIIACNFDLKDPQILNKYCRLALILVLFEGVGFHGSLKFVQIFQHFIDPCVLDNLGRFRIKASAKCLATASLQQVSNHGGTWKPLNIKNV